MIRPIMIKIKIGNTKIHVAVSSKKLPVSM